MRSQINSRLSKEEVELFQEITADKLMWVDSKIAAHRTRINERTNLFQDAEIERKPLTQNNLLKLGKAEQKGLINRQPLSTALQSQLSEDTDKQKAKISEFLSKNA